MNKLVIKIEKMHCAWCADHIKEILLNSFSVRDIEINVKDQIVKIISADKVNRKKLREEIIKIGYGDIEFID